MGKLVIEVDDLLMSDLARIASQNNLFLEV